MRKGKNFAIILNIGGLFVVALFEKVRSIKEKVIVIYPNGKTKLSKHFLFFKRYPKIVSGSEIFVTKKSRQSKKGLSLPEWSVLISSLAILSNLIINLKNN